MMTTELNYYPGEQHQAMAGFGFSEAFNKAGSIRRLGKPLADQVLDMLFSRERGIGAQILRLIIGDGGVNDIGWGTVYDGSADTIWPEETGGFVWDRPDWPRVRENFDRDQVWLAREAVKRGVSCIIASCWTAPYWMKTNHSVIGSAGAELKPEHYRDFAVYLAEYVLGYEREFGIRIDLVSPTNEPDITVGYPGCHWTPQTLADFTAHYLIPVFREKNVKAKICLPEHSHWGENDYIRALCEDPECAGYLAHVNAHEYNPSVRELDSMSLPRSLRAEIWMTEYCNAENGRNAAGIGGGLFAADLMLRTLTQADASAWLWWWGAANNYNDGSDLIRLCSTGTDQKDGPTENGALRVFKRFYTFGNFSRFIHPGMVRIGAGIAKSTNSPEVPPLPDGCESGTGLRTAAFLDRESGTTVIILINESGQDRGVKIRRAGSDQARETPVFHAYVTDAFRDLAVLGDTGTGKLTVPARSVVTLTTEAPGEFHPAIGGAGLFSDFSPGRLTAEGGNASASVYRISGFNFSDGAVSLPAESRGKIACLLKGRFSPDAKIRLVLDGPDGTVIGEGGMDRELRHGLSPGERAVYDLAAADGDAILKIPVRTCTEEELARRECRGRAFGIHDLYLVCAVGTAEIALMRFADW